MQPPNKWIRYIDRVIFSSTILLGGNVFDIHLSGRNNDWDAKY